MSTSKQQDDGPVHHLVVDASEPGLGVLVIDAEGGIVGRCAENQSQLKLDLPRGLYTLRSSRSGSFEETVVRLDSAQQLTVRGPAVFSAAMIPGAETTHEYYADPAWTASQNPTSTDLGWNGNIESGLLLFTRAARRESYTGEKQLSNLSLRAPDGRTLSNFDTDTTSDCDVGWSAYSARLSHGLLILEDCNEPSRQLPVPLIRGWQTQVFVMHRERLLWEDMRLTMLSKSELASRKHRSPNDDADEVRTAQQIDAGLLALQNQTPSMGLHLVESFMKSKSKNPILGLLGAYLLLQHYHRYEEHNAPLDKPDPDLIRPLLDELSALMPASADVVALQLLAKDWIEPPKLDPVERVPLFRCGAEVLLHAAASHPELLPEGSLLDAVSDQLYGDTVWTTWKPIDLPVNPLAELDAPELATTHTSREPSWVELAVVDAIAAAERREDGFSVDDLVRKIGVSPRSVRMAMNTLMARAAAQEMPTQVEWHNLRLLGGEVTRTLANELGARFEENIRELISVNEPTGEHPQKPSMQKVYSRLKKTLSELSGPDTGKISADTVLAEIIRPDDKSGWVFASRRLTQHFRDFNLALSAKEIVSAETVRDVAELVAKKLSD